MTSSSSRVNLAKGELAEWIEPPLFTNLTSSRVTFARDVFHRMFFITEGKAALFLNAHRPSGQTSVIELGAGDMLGEMSLLKDVPSMGHVVALEVSEAFYLSCEAFNAIYKEHEGFAEKIRILVEQRQAANDARKAEDAHATHGSSPDSHVAPDGTASARAVGGGRGARASEGSGHGGEVNGGRGASREGLHSGTEEQRGGCHLGYRIKLAHGERCHSSDGAQHGTYRPAVASPRSNGTPQDRNWPNSVEEAVALDRSPRAATQPPTVTPREAEAGQTGGSVYSGSSGRACGSGRRRRTVQPRRALVEATEGWA